MDCDHKYIWKKKLQKSWFDISPFSSLDFSCHFSVCNGRRSLYKNNVPACMALPASFTRGKVVELFSELFIPKRVWML